MNANNQKALNTVITDTEIKTWSGRTQFDTNTDYVNLHDFCKCNGTDESEEFEKAILKARSSNKKLISFNGKILISRDISLRHLNFDLSATEIKLINCTIHVGASGSSSLTKDQRLGIVYNNSFTLKPSILSLPSVKVWGSKCLKFTFDQIDYLLLYASTDPSVYPRDSSISYSSFTGELVTRLEFNTDSRYENGQEADGPGSRSQWINSNFFYISRIMGIDIKGSYQHNGNVFYNSTLETTEAYLNLEVGNKNVFLNIRTEGYPKIFLSASTIGNIIERTWFSTEATVLSFPNVTDLGVLNKVTSVHETRMHKYTILRHDARIDTIFNGQPLNMGSNLNVSRRKISSILPYQFISKTNVFEIAPTDIINFYCDTISDVVSKYIARVYFYDKDMNLCTDIEEDWFYSVNFKKINKLESYLEGYFLSVGSTFLSLHEKARKRIKYIAVALLTNTDINTCNARWLNVTLMSMRNLLLLDRTYIEKDNLFNMPLNKPSKFIGKIGDIVNGYSESWRCIFSLDTKVSSVISPESISVDKFYLNSVFSGWKVGDIIGIDLNDGSTHWTCIKEVNAEVCILNDKIPFIKDIEGNNVYISRLK
ncbi:hypothetical protein [Acinetobacter rudis]|uniref:Uncharacterized protein n=3 Tax=Acinetobacter rudis TaxID=632955 RepID=S3MV18_9GAMM|nr:hypothetical protein [Acinetobacter rudis]EPF71605.1 hypothetical protein F945_02638 [Acinetobacter rudis CIP 110305]